MSSRRNSSRSGKNSKSATTSGRPRPIRCTRNACRECCSAFYDENQIYKDKQEGYYSIRQEQFLTDKERGPDGEFGPEWGEVEHRVEENYYFQLAPAQRLAARLSAHSSRLRHARFPSDRADQRGRKTERRSLHLTSEIAAQLGHRAALRSRLRQLRLVRCPDELYQLYWL